MSCPQILKLLLCHIFLLFLLLLLLLLWCAANSFLPHFSPVFCLTYKYLHPEWMNRCVTLTFFLIWLNSLENIVIISSSHINDNSIGFQKFQLPKKVGAESFFFLTVILGYIFFLKSKALYYSLWFIFFLLRGEERESERWQTSGDCLFSLSLSRTSWQQLSLLAEMLSVIW